MKMSLVRAVTLLLVIPFPASAGFFNVFKAAVMVPVVFVEGEKTVTKTLTAKEFVNLTLGQPLDTPLGTKILVLKLDFEDRRDPVLPPPTPETSLVLWDTALPGGASVDKTAETVAVLTELDFDEYDVGSTFKGQGIATATIAEGTADASGNNKFFAVTLHGSGKVSQPSSSGFNTIDSAGLKVTGLSGRVHFKYTDANHPAPVDVFGIALKGSLTTAGKPIATFHN